MRFIRAGTLSSGFPAGQKNRGKVSRSRCGKMGAKDRGEIFPHYKVFNINVDKFVEKPHAPAANCSQFNILVRFAHFLCNSFFVGEKKRFWPKRIRGASPAQK
jgi:hypothetical protein